MLNIKTGKYLAVSWAQARDKAMRDMDSRETLTQLEKDFLELTDIQIGSLDPRRLYKTVITAEGKKKQVRNPNYSID